MPGTPVFTRLFGLPPKHNKPYKHYMLYSERGRGLESPAPLWKNGDTGDKILYVKVY